MRSNDKNLFYIPHIRGFYYPNTKQKPVAIRNEWLNRFIAFMPINTGRKNEKNMPGKEMKDGNLFVCKFLTASRAVDNLDLWLFVASLILFLSSLLYFRSALFWDNLK
jgi:hypothetical protein